LTLGVATPSDKVVIPQEHPKFASSPSRIVVNTKSPGPDPAAAVIVVDDALICATKSLITSAALVVEMVCQYASPKKSTATASLFVRVPPRVIVAEAGRCALPVATVA